MFSITGNQAFDYFIMESDQKRQNIAGYIDYTGNNLAAALNHYNYRKSDFTDPDWAELVELYGRD